MRGTSHGPVSVCVCVRLSQVRVLLKRLNAGSHKEHHTIAQGLYFSDAKDRLHGFPGLFTDRLGLLLSIRPLSVVLMFNFSVFHFFSFWFRAVD